MKAVVVGSGAWGTALAIQLCKNGHDVTMWTFEKELIPQMENERHNIRLPNVKLPENLKISGDYACISGCKLVVMASPSFPALQGFRGGKGILSGWFIAFMIDWRVGALIGIVFFGAYLITQYVSLGSVLAAATFGIGFALFHWGNPYVVAGGIFMGVLTIFQHRGNIQRLVKGQERKTNLLSKGKAK